MSLRWLLVGLATTLVLLSVNVNQLTLAPVILSAQQSDPCVTIDSLTSEIVAHFTFEGKADDLSSNQLQATATSGVDFGKGKCNAGVWFDERSELKITVPHTAILDVPYQFTISVWVYPTRYRDATSESHVLISQWLTSSQHGNYLFRLGSGEQAGQLLLAVANTYGKTFNSDYLLAPADQKVPLNTWSHVAATFNRGIIRLYLNGQLIAQKTTVIQHTETIAYDHNDLNIGNLWTDQFHSYGYVGGMDELYIFNRALTSQEIRQLAHKQGSPSATTGAGPSIASTPLSAAPCPTLPLVVGKHGQISPQHTVNLRQDPSTRGIFLVALPPGSVFDVIEGPVCVEGYAWWQIRYYKYKGWVPAGFDGDYWLRPGS